MNFYGQTSFFLYLRRLAIQVAVSRIKLLLENPISKNPDYFGIFSFIAFILLSCKNIYGIIHKIILYGCAYMYSMTGYGKGVATADGKTVTIEIKSVNHRFLDLGLKTPRTFLFIEDAIKKAISSRISRGHVDVFITYEQTLADGEFCADVALADSYMRAVELLSNETGLANDLTLSSLVRVSDVIKREHPVEDEDLLRRLTLEALSVALDNLIAMRKVEGESLRADVSQKLDCIQSHLDEIIKYAPLVVEDYRNQLNARINEAIAPSLVDAQRLATEVALYADHCAIDEETTRLGLHIVNMRAMLQEDAPIGRKMDFLVQELNRETNTIGSKANDMRITTHVLAIKNEIEKIREQTANVE